MRPRRVRRRTRRGFCSVLVTDKKEEAALVAASTSSSTEIVASPAAVNKSSDRSKLRPRRVTLTRRGRTELRSTFYGSVELTSLVKTTRALVGETKKGMVEADRYANDADVKVSRDACGAARVAVVAGALWRVSARSARARRVARRDHARHGRGVGGRYE